MPALSPADAYVATLRASTQAVRFESLADSPDELTQVASAFRAAENNAGRWVQGRAGWSDFEAREMTQAFTLGAGSWLMAEEGDFIALLRELRIIWRAQWERMVIPTRVSGTTLVVALPEVLLITNRLQVIEAVAAGLAPGIRRLEIDASALRAIDSAGLGALARIARMSLDATSVQPRMTNAGAVLCESMRSVLLLGHFEVRRPARAERVMPGRRWTLGRSAETTEPRRLQRWSSKRCPL